MRHNKKIFTKESETNTTYGTNFTYRVQKICAKENLYKGIKNKYYIPILPYVLMVCAEFKKFVHKGITYKGHSQLKLPHVSLK